HVTWRNILIGIFPQQCVLTETLDVCGQNVTGSDGTVVFRLSFFVCLDPGDVLGAPVNVVATPNSVEPFFLSVQHSLVDNAADVEITVSMWDPSGAPAPGAFFDWRCRVAYVPGVVIFRRRRR